MKIRFVRNISVDVNKIRLHEVWPKYFYQNDEVLVDSISYSKQSAMLTTSEGDLIDDIPIDSFEIVEKKATNLLTSIL